MADRASARDSPAPPLEVGRRVAVTFSSLALDGAATAQVGRQVLAVRYAIPGEVALVKVVERDPLRGEIVALQRKSAEAATPPCPHFGRCGGCQLQHITLDGQRRNKTAMVAAALAGAGVAERQVRPCRGAEGWAYRSVLRGAFDRREGETIAGFYGWGERRLYNIETCPIQHPTNVRILEVVREAVRDLGLPPYGGPGRGLVRGVLAVTGHATGEALAVLSTAAPLPDRMAFVRAVLDRVDGLVGLFLTIQPGRSVEFFGPGLTLLWGRAFIEEEILGLRVRLDPRSEIPPNPRAFPLLLEAIVEAAALREDEQIIDLFAGSGLIPLALAGRVRRAVGVTSDRRAMEEAWATAARNGIANAVFYTRDPAKVLAKLHERGERTDVVLAGPPGEGLAETLSETLAGRGPRRLVYVGRSLHVTARDLARLGRAGYAVEWAQPVDLFPQTSHLRTVVALRRR